MRSTLKALKKHQKNAHEVDIDLVTCKICDKQLSTKFKLRTHMLVHSNAKPFSCTHCSETFKERRNVIKHIKLKHISKKPSEKAQNVTETHNNDDYPGELKSQDPDLNESISEESSSTECMDTSCETVNEESNIVVNENDQPDSTEHTE